MLRCVALDRGASQLGLCHDDGGEILEPLQFALTERRARLAVDDAQRAQDRAIMSAQWHPRVEPDMRRTGAERVVAEPRVGGGVGAEQRLFGGEDRERVVWGKRV